MHICAAPLLHRARAGRQRTEKETGGTGRMVRSEQAEAREAVEEELCHPARTLQQPTEQGTRGTLRHPTQPHAGSNSRVRSFNTSKCVKFSLEMFSTKLSP